MSKDKSVSQQFLQKLGISESKINEGRVTLITIVDDAFSDFKQEVIKGLINKLEGKTITGPMRLVPTVDDDRLGDFRFDDKTITVDSSTVKFEDAKIDNANEINGIVMYVRGKEDKKWYALDSQSSYNTP